MASPRIRPKAGKTGADGTAPAKERRSLLGNLRTRTRTVFGKDGATVVVVALEGRVTFGDGDELLKKAIDQILGRQCRRVILDLSEVSYMDSSGVDAIVRSHNKLADGNGVLRLVITSERIHNLFEITKLLSVIEIFDSEAEACAGL